ncbi:GDSL-type esterase/lipase family protein [Lacisediminihabitans sp.]|uniref:GDSL-type esterase/lipase family protein n=1 Tax=Lacisediminihabitans sp. TaxID=2787631 RepID=UPI00374CE195
MAQLLRVLRPLVRPLIAWNYSAGWPTRMSAGTPTDAPFGMVGGRNPISVLVAGGIAGAGIGVLSYQQGLACQLAGVLSRASGRGVDWESLARPSLRLAATGAAVSERADLPSFDVVIILTGVADALALTTMARWRRDLDETLTTMLADVSPAATIIVTAVPDVADQVRVGRFVTAVLRDQIRALNETALAVTARYHRVNFVALPPLERADFDDDVFSYASLYRRWGQHLAALTHRLMAD